MANYLVQTGTELALVSRAGVVTPLSLSSDFTLYGETQRCRPALIAMPNGTDAVVVVVNGANRDFFIQPNSDVLPLNIVAPTSAPTLAAGASTGLTGVYRVACTFKVKDADGRTLYETALGPTSSASASLVNQSLAMSAIPVSNDSYVTARGVYRSLAGGTVLYPWFDIDNNTNLTDDRSGADALLSILPTTADRNGAPPLLKLIVTWKGRLWGVPRLDPDYLRWTEESNYYGWAADNEIIVPPVRTDEIGVTAFIPRRDQLGVAKEQSLFQMVGDDNNTFQRLEVSPDIGCVSQESVVVVRDTAYFLGLRGVVEWSAEGIGYVSEAMVDPWFTTDTHFNRALFPKAQGRYNPDTDSYELLLASAGSDALDTWVSFDLKGRRWFGPHETTAFTPMCAGNDAVDLHGELSGEDGATLAVWGGDDGHLWKRDTSTPNDGTTAVEFDVLLPHIHAGLPDSEKVFGQLSVQTERQTGGGQLEVIASVGEVDSEPTEAMTHDLTQGRERLGRLGTGKFLQMRLRHSGVGESLRVYGLELPCHLLGRR